MMKLPSAIPSKIFFKRIMSVKWTRRGRAIFNLIGSVNENTTLAHDFNVLRRVVLLLAVTRKLDTQTARLLSELHFTICQVEQRIKDEVDHAG